MKPLEKTLAACLLFGIVAIWFAYPHVLLWLFSPSATLEKLGPFGDLYGGLNTLFSGLALFGLGVNIYMQGVQIKKLEVKEQQNEDQLKAQAEALRLTALLNYYTSEFGRLTSHISEIQEFAKKAPVEEQKKEALEFIDMLDSDRQTISNKRIDIIERLEKVELR